MHSNMNLRYHLTIVLMLIGTLIFAQQAVITVGKVNNKTRPPHRVEGFIFSSSTGESLIGATIYIPRQEMGTTSDVEGKYSLELYEGTYTLEISSIGYEKDIKTIKVIGPGELNFALDESITELSSVIVAAEEEDSNVKGKDIGKSTITVESISSLPPLAGEVDVLKSLTLLPGVSTVGEASSGFNVRGGGSDQNLILLGGATLYNPNHMFGFFSSFNADVIRDVTLYKGGIPANYGGRGSSIVDITYKKGNFRNWEGSGSLGIVSSKGTIGGPIIPGKMSILVGARGSYTNWLLRTTRDPNIRDSRASFYDTNAILNYAINNRNELEYSFYLSHDDFEFASDTTNSWENMSHALKWSSTFNDRLTLNVTAVQNQYNAKISNDLEFSAFDLENGILDNSVSLDVDFRLNDNNTIKVGGQGKLISVNPGTFEPLRESSQNAIDIQEESAIESGLYFHHEMDITEKLGFSYGLRYSNFRIIGPNTVYDYAPLQPIAVNNIVDSTAYGDGELIDVYDGFEPRLSVRYEINNSTSVKAGFNRMNQYIHLITNTTAIAPTDVWKLSDPFILPEIVTQVSLGIFKNFLNNRIETSIEGYYKTLDNIVEYQDGADLFLNDNLETVLLRGDGRAYGAEFYVNKKQGRFNGWFSYTYSRSLRQVISPFDEKEVNDGKWYPSNFDKPHNATGVMKYRVGRLSTISAIFTYSTGQPITLPLGKFVFDGAILAYFDDRNAERAPDYHRLDFSYQFKLNTPVRWIQGDWTLAIYNVYGRKNAYSVFFRDQDGNPPQAYKLTVVGSPFPSLTYSFKF